MGNYELGLSFILATSPEWDENAGNEYRLVNHASHPYRWELLQTSPGPHRGETIEVRDLDEFRLDLNDPLTHLWARVNHHKERSISQAAFEVAS